MESSSVEDQQANSRMQALAKHTAGTFKESPVIPETIEGSDSTKRQTSKLYAPLKEGEFRLLSISPSDSIDAPLVCTLRAVSLATARYSAISYVWGDPSNPEEAQINGHTVQLQQNLASALRHIRAAAAPEVCNAIWADAVCINQRDVPEKNRQVMKMHHIYSYAKLVVGWLGLAQPNINAAFRAIRRTAAMLEDPKTSMDKMTLLANDFDWPKDGTPSWKLESGPWKGLRELHDHVYWTRGWIYQEVLVSEQLVFMCGEDFVIAEQLRMLYNALDRGDSGAPNLNILNNNWVLFGRLNLGGAWRTMTLETRGDRTLMLQRLLSTTGELCVSDPRDKIYSLIALAGLEEDFIPDYSRSTQSLYISTCSLLLENETGMSFLAMGRLPTLAHHLTADPPMPSWVPNWHEHSKCDGGVLPTLHPYVLTSIYDAATFLKGGPRISESINGWNLAVDGYMMGTIETVRTTQAYNNHVTTQTFLDNVMFLLNNLKQANSSLPSLQAACRILCADLHGGRRASSLEDTSLVYFGLACLKRLVDWYRYRTLPKGDTKHAEDQGRRFGVLDTLFFSPPSLDVLAKALCEHFLGSAANMSQWTPERICSELSCVSSTETISMRNVEAHSHEWGLRAEGWMRSHALIRSSRNHFGYTPPDTKVGDKICILKGCGFPVILRQQPHYVYVGPCFLYGFMDGEIVRTAERGEIQEQRFVIY